MKCRKLKRVKFFSILALSLCFVFLWAGCKNSDSDNENNPISVSIAVGDVYEITGGSGWLFESTDDEIAYVREDGIIVANDEGDVVITMTTNSGKKQFNVSCHYENASEKGSYDDFADIKSQKSYIGKGFNVITGSYLDSNQVNLEYPIFDDEKLAANNVSWIKDTSYTYKYSSATGTSVEDFMSEYTNKIVGHAEASYKKYFSASFDADFSTMAKNNT